MVTREELASVYSSALGKASRPLLYHRDSLAPGSLHFPADPEDFLPIALRPQQKCNNYVGKRMVLRRPYHTYMINTICGGKG
jgi:hypothetical protein